MKPKVSIITRVYNEKDSFLLQAIDSILMQKTTFCIEILLAWNNGSASTYRICEEYAKMYPEKIVFLKRLKTLSAHANFFDAITKAKGQYIAVLDADDYWTDELQLQKEVDFLERNAEFSIVYSNSLMMDMDSEMFIGTEIGECRRTDFSQRELIEGKHISLRTIMLRNVIDFSKIDTRLAYNDDLFICALIGMYGKGHYMENINYPVYRIRRDSIWSTKNAENRTRMFLKTLRSLFLFFKSEGNKGMSDFYVEKFFQTNDKYMFLACQARNKKAAWRSFCITLKGVARKAYLRQVLVSFKSLIKCLCS